MNAWETARQAGQKYFYEAATDTIRQCPENYMVLYHCGNGEWTASQMDAAIRMDREKLELFLDQGWRHDPNGAAVARALQTCEWLLTTVTP